ncbi:hypothetical protein [Streptomyces sp. NRRL F-2799]|nr:hypothetical protein [Streptomyces sp. NRRL F-2799]
MFLAYWLEEIVKPTIGKLSDAMGGAGQSGCCTSLLYASETQEAPE